MAISRYTSNSRLTTNQGHVLADIDFQEAQEASIDLSNDDPEALQRMLEYLYSAEYNDGGHVDEFQEDNSSEAIVLDTVEDHNEAEASSTSSDHDEYEPTKSTISALMNNTLVYALAEQYDIQPLKELAKTKFHIRSVPSAIRWDEDSIIAIAEKVYNTTPTTDRGLRDMVACHCYDYIDESSGQFLQSSKLDQLCTKDGALALDILKLYDSKKVDLTIKIHGLEASQQARDKAITGMTQRTERLQKQLKSDNERAKRDEKSLKDRLATTRRHAEEEQAALKALILRDTKCRHCERSLKVRVAGPFQVGTDRDTSLSCRYCNQILETFKPS